MNTNQLIDRVRRILLAPKSEWPIVATEPTTVKDLYKSYIVILAAIPAVLQFIQLSVIGTNVWLAGRVRLGVMDGLTSMMLGYALSLALVYVMALVVEALAPRFSGEKNRLQALKVVTYAFTAIWVASIGIVVPGLWALIAIAGVAYTIYLLYLGLPVTMKCPQDRAAGYVATTIVIGIVFSFIGNAAVSGIVSFGSYGGSAFSRSDSSDVKLDKDSPLGKLQAYTANLEKATKKLEVAQKSNDGKAQQDALESTLAAAFGFKPIEALAPDRLKSFIPETLGGRQRMSFEVARSKEMGAQTSTAKATFASKAGQSFQLEITDLGATKSVLGLAALVDPESEKETSTGYERTFRDDDRFISEKWNKQRARGAYSMVVGGRFTVKVEGQAESFDELKAAMAELDLAGLEKLRDEGIEEE